MLADGMKVEEIAEELETTVYDLKQFLHRNRLFAINKDGRNLAYEIIKLKFRHPEYFKPTRSFFRAVKITQRRWWSLYRGEARMTEEEFKRVTLHIGLTLEEAFECRQLNWVEELENK